MAPPDMNQIFFIEENGGLRARKRDAESVVEAVRGSVSPRSPCS